MFNFVVIPQTSRFDASFLKSLGRVGYERMQELDRFSVGFSEQKFSKLIEVVALDSDVLEISVKYIGY
ncbi:hypothetical protein Bca4012_019024 [Brassica carinata]